MGDSTNTATHAKKRGKFATLKSEFKKVVWPDKKSLTRQTIAVLVISVVLGGVIAIVDAIYTVGIDWLFR